MPDLPLPAQTAPVERAPEEPGTVRYQGSNYEPLTLILLQQILAELKLQTKILTEQAFYQSHLQPKDVQPADPKPVKGRKSKK